MSALKRDYALANVASSFQTKRDLLGLDLDKIPSLKKHRRPKRSVAAVEALAVHVVEAVDAVEAVDPVASSWMPEDDPVEDLATIGSDLGTISESNLDGISPLEMYKGKLLTDGMMVVCNPEATTILVPSYSTVTTKYVIVCTHTMQFIDGRKPVFMCTCNRARAALIRAGVVSNMAHQDFSILHGTCLHIEAIKGITPEPDANAPDEHNYAGQDDGIHLIQVPFDLDAFVLVAGPEASYLSPKNGQPYCHVCRSPHCTHTKMLGRVKDSDNRGAIDQWEDRLERSRPQNKGHEPIPKAVGEPIPFHIPPQLKELFGNAPREHVDLVPHAGGACQCGGTFGTEPMPSGPVRQLYCLGRTVTCQSFLLLCSACGQKGEAREDTFILDMGTYFVHHNILRDYMSHFLCSGTSMYNYHLSLSQNLQDCGVEDSMSYKQFRWAWLAYLSLLAIPEADGFQCAECGQYPRAVIMDGTTLGYHRKYAERQLTSHSDRIVVRLPQLRNLLAKYCKGLSPGDWDDLLSLARAEAPFVTPLLDHMSREGHTEEPEGAFKALFRELSKATPACGLLHMSAEMEDVVQGLMTEDHFNECSALMKTLSEQCPLLWELIAGLGDFPLYLRPLIHHMWQVAKAPFVGEEDEEAQEEVTTVVAGQCFPSLPVVRPRGFYRADEKRREGKTCRKHAPRHYALIPGLFTILCPHGVCYGYSIMESPESVDIPFTILKTRWQTAPNAIFYDNACKMHSYCLNRSPKFFRNSWFLVDRLHWRNHKGCSHGYNSHSYPQLASFNTQVAEQFNARLKKLKHHLPYMTREHFLQHLHLYVWHHSKRKAT